MAEDLLIKRARPAYFVTWPLLTAVLSAEFFAATDLGWHQTLAILAPTSALLVFLCHSCWYLTRATPIRGTSLARLTLSHLAAASVVILLWTLSFEAVIAVLERAIGWRDIGNLIAPQMPLLGAVGLLYYLFTAAYHYLLIALGSAREAERRAVEARLLAQGSELKALKAQINPHFLFNSLHSISALTGSDPARAREMCILLSDFLRSTLGLGDRASVPLRDELGQVRRYLTIEKVRFGDRLRFEEEVDDEALDCEVPPLILQPLVENAVKHGVATMIDETRITLRASPGVTSLHLTLENQYDPDAESRTTNGVGLKNVHQRLQAAYGKETSIRATGKGEVYVVELDIPCHRQGRL
jgi:two-component system, LytTR family, sensor histidine kinase AlgZ